MTFLKYVYSDRKALKYWIAIFSIVLFIAVLALLITNQSNDSDYKFNLYLYLPVAFILVFICFYLTGYWTYLRQQKFKTYIESELKLGRLKSTDIDIGYGNIFVKLFNKQGYEAMISIGNKSVPFEILDVNGLIILLGFVYDLGIFKRHIKPIAISNMKEYRFAWKYVLYPENVEIIESDGKTIITFEKNIEGIKYLIKENYAIAHNK